MWLPYENLPCGYGLLCKIGFWCKVLFALHWNLQRRIVYTVNLEKSFRNYFSMFYEKKSQPCMLHEGGTSISPGWDKRISLFGQPDCQNTFWQQVASISSIFTQPIWSRKAQISNVRDDIIWRRRNVSFFLNRISSRILFLILWHCFKCFSLLLYFIYESYILSLYFRGIVCSFQS